ncbi:MAG: heparinase II/III family protein, partial [Clostridia bacterium]
MYYGRNLGHGHPDTLNLGMAAFGINMAPELGYPEATGSDPNRAQWINNTISHNTVVVNEQKQTNIPDAAKPLHFDDAGQVKLMDVDSPSSYKGTTDIYRRTVVSVKADPTTSYSVDFFRIKGGDDHTYSFHSQSKEIFETEGLKFKEQKDASGEWVGTYAGADVAWGANSKYMNGYSWLKKVRRADKPGTGEFAVDFKITDFRTVLPYPQDLHLRMTMLNDFDLNEVSIVEGTPPRLKGNPDALEYVLARRNGKNLDSLFTTVYEPYKDDRYIESMAQVPTTIVSGKPGKADTVKAVKVTLKNGRIDYVVYATNNSVMYRVDDKFDFRGFVGVYMMKDGKVLSTYINDGDVIGDKTSVTSDYTGRVVDFTKGLVLNNSITVQMDGNVDPQSLVGRYVYIDNGAATGNAVYPIESATEANGRLVFGLGSVTLVNTYKDVNNMAKGFNYNIAEGQKFRIPMSAMDDATPVFANIGKQKATAGHIFNLRVAAVSPIDSKLTYEAVAIPAGAQFNAETQEIKWTPSDGQVGNNAFRFSVTDGLFTATLNFMVEVGPGTGGGGTGGSGTGDGTGDGKPPEEKPDE